MSEADDREEEEKKKPVRGAKPDIAKRLASLRASLPTNPPGSAPLPRLSSLASMKPGPESQTAPDADADSDATVGQGSEPAADEENDLGYSPEVAAEEPTAAEEPVVEPIAAADESGDVSSDEALPNPIDFLPDQHEQGTYEMPGLALEELRRSALASGLHRDPVSAAAESPGAGQHRVRQATSTNAIQGTPLYMSPEQCRGEVTLSGATDVYSFGVMLFELLEGRPPFVGRSVEDVLEKHQNEAIPVQSSVYTPDAVRDLVNRMLAKDPSQRPTTAEIIGVLQEHTIIGGPDIDGLEEESWTVDEVESEDGAGGDEESRSAGASPFVNLPPGLDQPPSEVAEVEVERDRRKLIVFLIGGALVLFAVLGFALFGGSEPDQEGAGTDPIATETSDEPTERGVADSDELDEAAAPVDDTAAVEEAADSAEAFEFGVNEPDEVAPPTEEGATADEPQPVEEEAVAEPPPAKVEKKRTRSKKRRKKKKEELRELRLEL